MPKVEYINRLNGARNETSKPDKALLYSTRNSIGAKGKRCSRSCHYVVEFNKMAYYNTMHLVE